MPYGAAPGRYRDPMRIRLVLVVALAATLAACSGGPSGEATFTGEEGTAERTPTVKAAAEAASGVELPANLPPASMFLGDGSHRTGPVRYCLEGECADLKPAAPPPLEGSSGAPVLFTLSAAPLRAALEVVKPGASAPEKIALTPGSSIAWQPEVPPGTYRLTLTAVYDKTEVSWPFVLRIVEGTRR